MDKAKALQKFWEQFSWDAYSAQTVPTGENAPKLPYITYDTSSDSFDNQLMLTASLWDNSMSWKKVEQKTAEIAKKIGENGYYIAKIDDGYMLVKKGSPFAQRMGDDDNSLRRVVINIVVEFLTAY